MKTNNNLKARYNIIYYDLYKKIKRDGFKEFLKDYGAEYLLNPCSSKYHLCCEGGLLIHSVNLYLKFKKRLLELKEYELNEESIILICLYHDVCKVNAYKKNYIGDYEYNKKHPKGHASLSLEILKRYMVLTEQEEDLIKYHMGTFGICGYEKEYTVEELNEAIKRNYLVQVFASCDMESSREENLF